MYPGSCSAALATLDDDDGPEAAWIAAELGAQVAEAFAAADARPLVVAARDGAGVLIGGLRGLSHWGWLYIRQLYVVPDARRTGVGARLMRAAEVQARKRGCIGIYVDTFSPEAAAFYRRLGFSPVGRIADFPPGHIRSFFARRLDGPV